MPKVQGTELVYSQPIYDTVEVPVDAVGGVAVAHLFAVPWGQNMAAGIPKTWRHTNLTQAGHLEAGNALRIDAISMFFPRTAQSGAFPTVADMDAVRAGNLRLKFGGDRNYLKMVIAGIPNAGMGVTYSTDAALAAEVNFAFNNGVSVSQNRFPLAQPIDLLPQETVGITLENMDIIVAKTQVMFFLWGSNVRPVG